MNKSPLSEAIEDFRRHRESAGYAKNTRQGETGTLRRFLTHVGNIYVHSLRADHIDAYLLDRGHLKARSANLELTQLRVFFQWCRDTRRCPSGWNPTAGRRRAPEVQRDRHRIPATRFPLLLDTAGTKDPRNRAMVALLLYTLARDAEIRNLRVRDVDLDSGLLHLVVNKSHLEDSVPISAELDRELRAWLTHYGEASGGLEPSYFLLPRRFYSPCFVPMTGKFAAGGTTTYAPATRMGKIAATINPLLEQIGVPTTDERGESLREGAHTIRRSGARALFDHLVTDGAYDQPLRIVQAMLHHKNQAMTEHYIGLTADKKRRDETIRGRSMYGDTPNVVQLTEVKDGVAS